MPSAVELSNAALSHLGSDAVVTSISPPDGSVEAGHCARFFGLARTEMLEAFPWRFALTRAALAPAPTNPSSEWAYAYSLPSDVLRPWRVLRKQTATVYDALTDVQVFSTEPYLTLPDERDCAPYEIEDTVLLTHEPEAVLIYSRDVTDAGKFTPRFSVAFSYLLASFIAGPLVKGSEGADLTRKFRDLAKSIAQEAAAIGANSGHEPANFIADSIRARA